MSKLKSLGELLKYHLTDTVSLNSFANPILGALEVTAYGLSDEVSLNTRILATGLSFLGMGGAFSKGRDFSKKLLKITDQTKERYHAIHDTIYPAAFNLLVAPPIYYASGARGDEIVPATLGAIAFGMVSGGAIGYVIDAFRDLTSLKECERASYPDSIREKSPGFKKTLATAYVLGSLAVMGGIYSLSPDKFDGSEQTQIQPAGQEIVLDSSEYQVTKIQEN